MRVEYSFSNELHTAQQVLKRSKLLLETDEISLDTQDDLKIEDCSHA